MKNTVYFQGTSRILLVAFFLMVCYKAEAIKPDREYILTPDSLGLAFEALNVKTPDNYDLNTWIYLPESENDNNKVLVLAYPDQGNMSYFVYHAALFVSRGYTVITFDYRGFGMSSDFEINPNFLYHSEFVIDLVAIVESMKEKYPGKQLGIWAMSMGTIITTQSMSQIKDKVDFIISEGFVTNPYAFVKRIHEIKDKEIFLPETSENYIDDLKSIEVPLLIFSASDDQLSTVEDSLSLKDTLGEHVQVEIYEGTHLAGFQVGENWGEYYLGEMDKFVRNTPAIKGKN